MVSKIPSHPNRQHVWWSHDSCWTSKSQSEAKVVTKQSPRKAVIATVVPQYFQTITDLREKTMPNNIFLPTSEFGRPKMYVFWLNIRHHAWTVCSHLEGGLGFPGGSSGKESACQAGDGGLIAGWGRCLGERNGNPLQYSCLENPMDRGAWWGSDRGVRGVAELDST